MSARYDLDCGLMIQGLAIPVTMTALGDPSGRTGRTGRTERTGSAERTGRVVTRTGTHVTCGSRDWCVPSGIGFRVTCTSGFPGD